MWGRVRRAAEPIGSACCRPAPRSVASARPEGDAEGEAIKRLQHAAGLNGAAAAKVPTTRDTWLYTTHTGAPLLEVVKYRTTEGERKTALRHRPEWHPTLTPTKPARGDGWSWSRPRIARGLLYRAQELHYADPAAPVLVAEGEKDCDRLHRLGFVATCPEGGAGKWIKAHVKAMPADRAVVILADADKPGMRHAADVAAGLWPVASSVRIVTPEQLGFEVTESHGRDVSDWLDADPARGAADVQALIEAAVDAASVAPLPAEAAPAPVVQGARRPPKGGGIDAGEAALEIAPGWKGTCMYVEGRGWFLRANMGELWIPASIAELHGKLQSAPEWAVCKRGTRTSAIEAELTGQLHVGGALLDADDWTAGLPDGRVLDLRYGTVRAPVPGDLITMRLGAVPDDSGPPATWLRFIGSAFKFADDLDGCARYFRWWVRTALTGDVAAQRMIFLHGQSGTGKNTIADLVLYLAGDYGAAVSAQHVTSQRGEHRQWLAKLAGKRFALVGDVPTGGQWSAELHDLVGGAKLEANLMRRNSIEFVSHVHVMATGNTSPTGQAGIWRRLVQYECRFKPTEEQKDTELPAKLRAEAGRILQWALTGDVDEPPLPAELAAAAEAVRDEQDPVAAWVREGWRPDPRRRTSTADLYAAYLRRFFDVPQRDQLTETAFGKLLTAEFGPAVRRTVNGAKVMERKCCEQ